MELKESEERIKEKDFLKEWLKKEMNQKNYNEEDYVKPEFKPLTKEQINNIHERGKITPEEMVEEWEDFGLCAPGDSGFNERCHNFANCHDCLVDYSNQADEYESLIAFLELRSNQKPIGNVIGNTIFGDSFEELKTSQEVNIKRKSLKQ